jgi:hypothetical protein
MLPALHVEYRPAVLAAPRLRAAEPLNADAAPKPAARGGGAPRHFDGKGRCTPKRLNSPKCESPWRRRRRLSGHLARAR